MKPITSLYDRHSLNEEIKEAYRSGEATIYMYFLHKLRSESTTSGEGGGGGGGGVPPWFSPNTSWGGGALGRFAHCRRVHMWINGPYRRWAWRFCAICAPVNPALLHGIVVCVGLRPVLPRYIAKGDISRLNAYIAKGDISRLIFSHIAK